jgi:hypothetical protein
MNELFRRGASSEEMLISVQRLEQPNSKGIERAFHLDMDDAAHIQRGSVAVAVGVACDLE